MTKKIRAYGSVVVAALVMGFALLTAASAAPSVSDSSITITGDDTQTLTAIDENRGQYTAAPTEGVFSIVTQPASGGSVSVANGAVANVESALTGAVAIGDTTINVSTTNFPSSGLFFLDDGNNISDADNNPTAGLAATDEIISCTGSTSTTLTGCTRGVGNTSPNAFTVGEMVIPIAAHSVVAQSPFITADLSVTLADSSDFAASGQIITIPATITDTEAMAYTGKSNNSLTGINALNPVTDQPVGTDIIQFGRTVDTGTATIDVDSGFSGSFTYEFDYDQVAGDKTVTVTVIDDNPVANDVEGTVSATLPTPLPIIIVLGGSDSSSVSSGPSLLFTALPTKGLLSTTTPTLSCADVSGAVIGEVLTNCSSQLVYTPLAGATGTDTFTYTITNGGDTSAEATVTIVLPGGSSTTPGAGFNDTLVAGVNLTSYGGGTLSQLATDAAAAGATSVSVTSGGNFLVHVVGAPDFVNADFAANFSDGNVPAGTVVLVVVSS